MTIWTTKMGGDKWKTYDKIKERRKFENCLSHVLLSGFEGYGKEEEIRKGAAEKGQG